jgi:hypothetical protein
MNRTSSGGLTYRTLRLATMAFVLACVHAGQALGHGPLTFSGGKSGSRGGSSFSGAGGVATFTPRQGSGRSGVESFAPQGMSMRISKPGVPVNSRAAAVKQMSRIEGLAGQGPVIIRTAYSMPDDSEQMGPPAPIGCQGSATVRPAVHDTGDPVVPESALKDPVLRAALARPAAARPDGMRNAFAMNFAPPAGLVVRMGVTDASSPGADLPADGSTPGTPSSRRSCP